MNSKITLESLRVLSAIDTCGSFRSAAEAMDKVPSAISHTIAKLERELGIQIFDRTGHKAIMTPAGDEILREGREILRAAAELEARAKRVAESGAEMRIGLDYLIPVEPIVPILQFLDEQAIDVRVHFTRESLSGAWDALIWNRVDVVVGATGEPPGRSGFDYLKLGEVQTCFVAAPDHALSTSSSALRLEDLRNHCLITPSDTSRERTETDYGRNVTTVVTLRDKLVALRAGLGYGRLPQKLAEDEQARNQLTILNMENQPAPQPVYTAWRTGALTQSQELFVEQLKSRSGEILDSVSPTVLPTI